MEEALGWICANNVARPVGKLTYTQMLNSRGGIECDLTVARLAEDHFYIVTGTGFRTHDFAWIADHIRPGLDARLTDITEAFGTLSVMGPKSRAVIQAVTKADMSNAAFKFGEVREIEIAGHEVRALRVTYVGELGWELHMPIAATGDVFDALMAAGQSHGIAPVGYRALESLRLEKFYRAWSSDITPNDTPLHAGLGWAVKLKSNQPFMGRDAIEKISQAPLGKMLAGFTDRARGHRALGPRNHLTQWRLRGLSHQRRLWLHGAEANRLRLRQECCRRGRNLSPERELRTCRGQRNCQGEHMLATDI